MGRKKERKGWGRKRGSENKVKGRKKTKEWRMGEEGNAEKGNEEMEIKTRESRDGGRNGN